MVTTRPANKAGQLKSATSLGAANNMASVRPILTNSHTKKPVTAVAAFSEDKRPVKPRANTKAGKTTEAAPYNAETAQAQRPLTPPISPASASPAKACQSNTRQTETAGRSKPIRATCSRLRGCTGS